MKKILLTIVSCAAVATVFAGGTNVNTNHATAYLRSVARGTTLDPDAVYHNPAGHYYFQYCILPHVGESRNLFFLSFAEIKHQHKTCRYNKRNCPYESGRCRTDERVAAVYRAVQTESGDAVDGTVS